MPDWTEELRRRLAGLHLAPTREAAIVEEVDWYAEKIAQASDSRREKK
jgi:hypothetical protein